VPPGLIKHCVLECSVRHYLNVSAECAGLERRARRIICSSEVGRNCAEIDVLHVALATVFVLVHKIRPSDARRIHHLLRFHTVRSVQAEVFAVSSCVGPIAGCVSLKKPGLDILIVSPESQSTWVGSIRRRIICVTVEVGAPAGKPDWVFGDEPLKL
jgi:hypothetical protein